ncbi:MAG TPA: RnfABCDGE type electron transport complex subunit D [Candidatus Cloacimonadota bacterium]|nr:RnfABCDGE type electron transport complex subunit D [Candidatus Cloacimonadota bacterium]HPT72613.1 RnfABCDGE type electron transport complex subunit D [Candidatus Cloacimonadota bacterium]
MDNKFVVSAAPHLHDRTSVSFVMWQVVIALIPAMIAAVYFFGFHALLLTLYGGVAAMAVEALIQKCRKKPITIMDGSAFLTGMLVAFNLDAGVPWWLTVIGAVFAIAIGKHAFGGLGMNPMNPALLGRAFVLASWPTLVTSGWMHTLKGSINGIKVTDIPIDSLATISPKAYTLLTSATPLNVAKSMRDTTFVQSMTTNASQNTQLHDLIHNALISSQNIQHLFWGNIGGCLGEVSAFALLLGALWLIYNHIIEWRIPVSYILTVFVLGFLMDGMSVSSAMFQVLAGGVILGAFYMATDPVTSPMTKTGRIIFGIGCGVVTIFIRYKGGYPEGVCYSILLMNLLVPLIDKYTIPRAFGEVKK